jgi:hypothetical protein
MSQGHLGPVTKQFKPGEPIRARDINDAFASLRQTGVVPAPRGRSTIMVVLDEAMTYQRLCAASVWEVNSQAVFEYVSSGSRGTLPEHPFVIETNETVYCYCWNLPEGKQFPVGTAGTCWLTNGFWNFASADECIEDDPSPEDPYGG